MGCGCRGKKKVAQYAATPRDPDTMKPMNPPISPIPNSGSNKSTQEVKNRKSPSAKWKRRFFTPPKTRTDTAPRQKRKEVILSGFLSGRSPRKR